MERIHKLLFTKDKVYNQEINKRELVPTFETVTVQAMGSQV